MSTKEKAGESQQMTDSERADLEGFKSCVAEEVRRSQRQGYSTDRLASLGSAVTIAARHFAGPRANRQLPSSEYRQQLLAIAAEVTGIPLEPLPLADGTVAQAWRPAAGEVGWLPYEESPVLWGMKDVGERLGLLHPGQRHEVLTELLKDTGWAHPRQEEAAVSHYGLDEYQEQAMRTAGAFPIEYFSSGLAEEAGEVSGIIKKVVYHRHDMDRRKVAMELGDALWHIGVLAQRLGFPLSEVAAINVEKLRRRYPDGFSEERSRNREQEVHGED